MSLVLSKSNKKRAMCRASCVSKYSNKKLDDLRDAFFRARLRNTTSTTTCLRRETVGGLGRHYQLCFSRSWSLLSYYTLLRGSFSKSKHEKSMSELFCMNRKHYTTCICPVWRLLAGWLHRLSELADYHDMTCRSRKIALRCTKRSIDPTYL